MKERDSDEERNRRQRKVINEQIENDRPKDSQNEPLFLAIVFFFEHSTLYECRYRPSCDLQLGS